MSRGREGTPWSAAVTCSLEGVTCPSRRGEVGPRGENGIREEKEGPRGESVLRGEVRALRGEVSALRGEAGACALRGPGGSWVEGGVMVSELATVPVWGLAPAARVLRARSSVAANKWN